ncbi:MAG: hypothetical protein AB1656_13795 [Candidatus Omnitrophota bacterium]
MASKISNAAHYMESRPLLVFFLPFLLYMSNGREISNGDSIPSAMTAIHLAAHGTIYLDHLKDFVDYKTIPYYASEQGGHVISNYPLMPGIMAVPFFAPAYYAGMIREGEGDLVWRYVSKLSGAAFTALSVVFLFYAIRLLRSSAAAFVLSYSYGLGTALWPIASQSLWQHGPALFWITLSLYAMLRAFRLEEEGRTSSVLLWLMLGGAAIGFSVCCRSTNAIAAICLIAASLWQWRWRGLAVCVPAALIVLALFASNYWLFGSFSGGYDELYKLRGMLDGVEGGTWSTPLWEGLAGQLVSPSRGIFVFSPILLFAVWGMIRVWRLDGSAWRFIALMSPAPILLLMLFGKYAVWWGGSGHYGPRYQVETNPFLILFMAAAWEGYAHKKLWRGVFIVFLCWSIFVQAIGAFNFPSDWAVNPVKLSEDKGRLWSWSHNQIFSCLRSGIKMPFS